MLTHIYLAILVLTASPQDPWLPPLPTGPDPLSQVTMGTNPEGIIPLPDGTAGLQRWFNRYTRVLAPNGKPIHILAQDGWRDEQILRARNVLKHMLADAPGTRWGANKAPIANAMSERRATLVLFNDHAALERAFDNGLDRIGLGFQDLRANECPVEGDPDYMDHRTRDAAFEEILHLVQDYGIRPVLPEYDAALHRANLGAAGRDVWNGWPRDEPENHRNEYFAAAYDNYLDLWAVRPTLYEGETIEPEDVPQGTSHFGNFSADSRSKLKEVDPIGYGLIEDFFPSVLTYTAKLPVEFKGTFVMSLTDSLPYTHKSQHLVSVELTGKASANLVGNGHDNHLTGNAGSNSLEGGKGDDVLAGDDGVDTARYTGKKAEYSLGELAGATTITDSVPHRDGTDTLIGVEWIEFSDCKHKLP